MLLGDPELAVVAAELPEEVQQMGMAAGVGDRFEHVVDDPEQGRSLMGHVRREEVA